MIRSEQVEWPAAFVIDIPAAEPDARGFLTVAGSPQVLVMDRADDFFRVVYADFGSQRHRLK